MVTADLIGAPLRALNNSRRNTWIQIPVQFRTLIFGRSDS